MGMLLALIVGIIFLRTLASRSPRTIAVVLLGTLGVLLFLGAGALFFHSHDTMVVVREVRSLPTLSADSPSFARHTHAETAAEIEGEIPLEVSQAGPSSGEPATPAWVKKTFDNQPGGDMLITVSAGPYETRERCEQDLPAEMQRLTGAYIDTLHGPGAGRLVSLPLDYIQTRLRQPEVFEEPLLLSFGPMLKLHTRLKFDDAARAEIARRYDAALVRTRLAYTGGGAGVILALIGTLFGYLKLDTLTRGYYSGRLKLAAGAVILAVGVATAALARVML
jgi:hypothetical protein